MNQTLEDPTLQTIEETQMIPLDYIPSFYRLKLMSWNSLFMPKLP